MTKSLLREKVKTKNSVLIAIALLQQRPSKFQTRCVCTLKKSGHGRLHLWWQSHFATEITTRTRFVLFVCLSVCLSVIQSNCHSVLVCETTYILTFSSLQLSQERLQYRANASSVNSGRNKDGFNSNSNNYYGGNHRRGDRDQNRDGRSYGNNRDHNNPNYRRKGSGEYRPNHDRNANHAYRQKQQGNIDVTTTESSQLSNPAPERPKLELKPRTTPLETEPSRDPNIFGIGKAREYQEDPMIQTLDLNDRGSNGQTEINKEMAVDSQNRAYTNKSNLSTDKRFSQDRFKGGGRGNLKGRDKKSKNSEDGGKSNHTKVNLSMSSSFQHLQILCSSFFSLCHRT